MAWNIKDAVYSRAKDVSAQTGSEGIEMFLSPDGLKLYVAASPSRQRIYEYTLSEVHNITTASYVHSRVFDMPYGLWISPDGTKLYVTEDTAAHIKQYTLGTPWDITSASLVYDWFFHAHESRHAVTLFINEDGTKLFIGDTWTDEVHEYALSTPWDLTTEAYVKSFSVAAQVDNWYGLFFKSDGKKMYVSGNGVVHQYELSTPWDIATAAHVHSTGTGGSDGLSIKSDGTRMYSTHASGGTVNEFNILASDYYVKPDGDDALDGESYENAWLTIDHVQANCGEGNTVNIAAGTYDEDAMFLFEPTVGTKWTGVGAAYTKLFTVHASMFTLTAADVEIHDCQFGDDSGGMGSGITVNADGNNFKLINCSNRATLLSFMGVSGMGCHGLSGGTAFFACMSSLTDCTFEEIVSDVDQGMFSIEGHGLVFNYIQFPNLGSASVECDSGSMSECVFKALTIYGGVGFAIDDLEIGSGGLTISSGDQTITNCKTLEKLSVSAGASAILSWYQQKFYESSNSQPTVIDAAGQTVLTIAGAVSNITFTERPFLITTNDDVGVLITSWELSGYQNKAWTVEAIGNRAIVFQLGDMLPNVKYALLVDTVEVSEAVSNAAGVVTFPEYSGSFSEKLFETKGLGDPFFEGSPVHETTIITNPTHK